jgi:hypothetical protein
MGKSKIPFKTNIDQSIPRPAARPTRTAAQDDITNGGIWIRTKKTRRISPVVVNLKKERSQLIEWILIWVVAIPLSAYILVWLLIVMIDLFTA